MTPDFPAPIVTSCKPTECDSETEMHAVKLSAVEPTAPLSALADSIRAFLDGETNGEALLHALYDHVLDEPIPPQMRELLRK
jgi:hypothetical protein